MMKILGIDPGSRITGWGLLSLDKNKIEYIASGDLKLGTGEFSGRLRLLHEELSELFITHQPTEFAIEKAFMAKNADSALKLGHARGVAVCVAALHDVAIAEYSPRSIKQAVVGTGAAAKEQVQHMVTAMLKPPHKLRSDEADALAIALCHAHQLPLAASIQNQTGIGRSKAAGRSGWSSWRNYKA